MLHITNGDAAADRIRPLGLEGEILPWRDVLHEGPVPAPASLDSLRPLRARFLASGSSGSAAADIARSLEERDRRLGRAIAEEEIALWFEHDLYDQLQLAQVLDAVAVRTSSVPMHPLMLVQADDYLGCLEMRPLRKLWEERSPATEAQLDAAQRVWRAFSDPDPRAIEAVLDQVGALPYMRAALLRHLEEFPSTQTGLSRSERQALEVLAEGPRKFRELFPATQAREEAKFLGDSVLYDLLKPLTAGDHPLLTIDDHVAITSAGRDVIAGRRDRIDTIGIDRWLGGVHLKGRQVPFRWDPQARRIVAS